MEHNCPICKSTDTRIDIQPALRPGKPDLLLLTCHVCGNTLASPDMQGFAQIDVSKYAEFAQAVS